MTVLYCTIYFLLCLYVSWRIKLTNENFYKNNPDYIITPSTNFEKFMQEIVVIFHGCYLIITILINGFKVLSYKRSIFNGELLK